MTLQEQLNDFKGSQIIGLDTITKVNLLGGASNPYKNRVQKLTEKSLVMVFKSPTGYKNMVNRRLKKENETTTLLTAELFERMTNIGDFQPGPRPWGKRLPNSPFVENKGNFYLECIFLKSGKSKYLLDGKEIPKSKIEHMLPEKSNGNQNGLKNKVVLRTFSLESIIKVRKGKKEIQGLANQATI